MKMDEQEFEDLENDLASHLKPVRDGEQRWAKAMERITHFLEQEWQRGYEEGMRKAREIDNQSKKSAKV